MLLAVPMPSGTAGSSGSTVGNFSQLTQRQLAGEWQPFYFSGRQNPTRYTLVESDGRQVLKAVSEQSASGLVRTLNISLARQPYLTWRWKITRLPADADESSKAGDDNAARLYVIFGDSAFGQASPGLWGWAKNALGLSKAHALNYIWANRLKVGDFKANAFSDKSIMVAVNGGEQRTGEWIEVKRNVLDDYQRAFGASPPSVSAIAIMTDADNTKSGASAYYGDIRFSAQADQPPRQDPGN